MSDTLALPPATPAAAPEATSLVNADTFADALRSTPMEDYRAPEPEPPKVEAPKPVDTPTGEGPKTDAPGTDGPAPGPEKRNVESAREIIEGYDLLQSYGFSAVSDGMKPEQFVLDKFPKERAVHHLAKGLEKMGSPEVPWWVGLAIALAIPAFINYRIAMAHRKDRAAERTAQNRQRAANGEPLRPDTITDREGNVVKPPPPPPPAPAAARTAPVEVLHPATPRKTYGPCEVCGNPVHRKTARYCGKSCSGKALNQRLRAKAAQA